jgi:Staphylococcal nuclease homologue.
MYNAKLLLEGYAQIATYPPDVKYADLFTKFQREARENNKGLWGVQEAAPEQPASTSTVQQPSTKAPETAKPAPAPEKKQSVTVYITRTGAKYHTYGCQYLRQSCIAIELDKG